MRKKTELEKFIGINEEKAEKLLGEVRAFVIAFSLKNARKESLNGKMLNEIIKSKHTEEEKMFMAYTLGFNLGRTQKG